MDPPAAWSRLNSLLVGSAGVLCRVSVKADLSGICGFSRVPPPRVNAAEAACTVLYTNFFRFSATQFTRICGFRSQQSDEYCG